LHIVKRAFPRIVMPGGLIERHLSRLHFGVNYQTVNIMDLVRLWGRFPDEDLTVILDGAIKAVTDSGLLRYWAELKQRQALGTWVEALYHLCTLSQKDKYRRYLVEAITILEDAGLGLSPSLLGANPEAVKPAQQIPCPSPVDPHLRVANLGCRGKQEILVVNCTPAEIEFVWEGNFDYALTWTSADGQPVPVDNLPLLVPPRSWLWGRQR
jgi:hypothetical protein